MRLTIICMGKTKEPFVLAGIEKYHKYIKPYIALEIKELKPEKILDLKEAPAVRKKEAEKIFKAVSPGAYVVGLDERGEELTSHDFAAFLNGNMESGVKETTFIIGGAMGLDEEVVSRSNKQIALSRLTFTHEMAKLVLLEQLYRSFTIIKGKTYHY